jgi:hypothetical protein
VSLKFRKLNHITHPRPDAALMYCTGAAASVPIVSLPVNALNVVSLKYFGIDALTWAYITTAKATLCSPCSI